MKTGDGIDMFRLQGDQLHAASMNRVSQFIWIGEIGGGEGFLEAVDASQTLSWFRGADSDTVIDPCAPGLSAIALLPDEASGCL